MQYEVLDALEHGLGSYIKTSRSNYAFKCPFCGHRKHKLEFDLKTGVWHCWVCNAKGVTAYSLLSQLSQTSRLLQRLKQVESYKLNNTKAKKLTNTIVKLPDSFRLFDLQAPTSEQKRILQYLYSRGLLVGDIMRYHIGFTDPDTVTIPSYNKAGRLNYYISKNIVTGNYTLPNISKDCIVFDLFIDWNRPVIFVEGVFDALAVRHNVIPLLGKTLQPAHKTAISQSSCSKFYICLDYGKQELKDSQRIADYITSIGKKAYIVDLESEGSDPGSLGYYKVWSRIGNSNEVDTSSLFTKSILDLW